MECRVLRRINAQRTTDIVKSKKFQWSGPPRCTEPLESCGGSPGKKLRHEKKGRKKTSWRKLYIIDVCGAPSAKHNIDVKRKLEETFGMEDGEET